MKTLTDRLIFQYVKLRSTVRYSSRNEKCELSREGERKMKGRILYVTCVVTRRRKYSKSNQYFYETTSIELFTIYCTVEFFCDRLSRLLQIYFSSEMRLFQKCKSSNNCVDIIAQFSNGKSFLQKLIIRITHSSICNAILLLCKTLIILFKSKRCTIRKHFNKISRLFL